MRPTQCRGRILMPDVSEPVFYWELIGHSPWFYCPPEARKISCKKPPDPKGAFNKRQRKKPAAMIGSERKMISAKAGKSENIRPTRMMPRTYRAKNIPSALAAMERDLGRGALIVSVHKIPPGKTGKVQRQSGVEIVAIPPAVKLPSDDPTPATRDRGTFSSTSL
jgi:hypothetical protein